MKVIEDLRQRGFISTITAEEEFLRPERQNESLTVFIGFDLTAPSLHVGSLIQLMMLRAFAADGHKVIALLGEATTKVGDPTGKDTARPLLNDATIASNRAGIEKIIRKLVPSAKIVSNGEWFDEQSFIGFLRDFGQHFTINRMNTFDTVKRRLESQQPMSFLEFTYMLLQAVDFLKLFERENCTLQIGGSDQWGNIVNGVELIRRVHGETAFGVTTVLLTDKSGKKMGKTAGGAVWLDESMTSPFDFFQFWRNVEDEKVDEFIKLFSERPLTSIPETRQKDINQAKGFLAREVTALVHGEEVANECVRVARDVFENAGAEREVEVVPGEMISQLIARLGWSESRGAARRLIAGNAVALGDEKLTEDRDVSAGHILRVGKKHTARLILPRG